MSEPVSNIAVHLTRAPAEVSFVVPAYNAAKTVGDTLACLLAQTYPSWEVIVVDDGSWDGTAALVEASSLRDGRIRLVRQANAGVSAARNTGIAHARTDWLVFLDADDHVSPRFAEIMLAALAQDPNAGVACCGFARTNTAGDILLTGAPAFDDDPFEAAASRALAPIHAFMVRRHIVQEVGGFDPGLSACEDWDLFQRVFRTGVRPVQTPEVLSWYVSRPGSLSKDGARMLTDARTVMLRSCAPDPRVPRPDPRYAEGARSPGAIEMKCLWIACWCSATAIGSFSTPPDLLDGVNDFSDTTDLGSAIVQGLVIGSGRPLRELGVVWPRFADRIADLVGDVAERSANPARARAILEDLAIQLALAGPVASPCVVGHLLVARFRPGMLLLGVPVPAGVDAVVLQTGWRKAFLHLPALGPLTASDILVARIDFERGRVTRRLFGIGLRLAATAGVCRSAVRRIAEGLNYVGRALFLTAHTPQGRQLRAMAAAERALPQNSVPPWSPPLPPAPVNAGSAQEGDAYWERHFETADPWNYTSPYEQVKYQRTLEMMPTGPIQRALELACAEGHFTVQLAPKVQAMTAVDISATALQRARARCAGVTNVSFARLNFFAEPIPGHWNLIVCSEVLYYLADVAALAGLAAGIRDALEPGGHLLTCHAMLLADDPDHTGYDWGEPFGANSIAAVFDTTSGLEHVRSLRAPLYRIDLFRRVLETAGDQAETVEASLGPLPMLKVQKTIVWGGAIASRAACNRTMATPYLPVLMYHVIAPGADTPQDRFRISPQRFEQQLRFLRRRGYRSVGLEEWSITANRSGEFAGRPVMLTFDDATADFYEIVWPILERNGFSAVVFAVTDKVGGVADWAGTKPPYMKLMGWEQIAQLAWLGVDFGSHLAVHIATDWTDSVTVLRSGARSRAALEHALGRTIEAMAFPYGVTSLRVRALMAASGYKSAFTVRPGIAFTGGDMLALPRIEIAGGDDLTVFARKLQLSEAFYPDARDLQLPA